MKISKKMHLHYMQMKFTLEEYEKILIYLDKNVFDGHLLENKQTDAQIWAGLVLEFNKIPHGKKTKAYIYQMLVVNGIVDDVQNNKDYCYEYMPRFKRTEDRTRCPRVNKYLSARGRKWESDDFNNICSNMQVCLRYPIPEYFVFDLNKEEYSLDDRIIQTKK